MIISNEEYQAILQQYGTNWRGKIPLCATCAYIGGYCLKHLRYYRCKDYIKDKEIEEWERLNANATIAEKNTQQTHEI